MKISVVVPVHNGARHLAACLDSVFASSLAPFEVLVVDDGSTDDTAQIAAGYAGVLYHFRQHEGASAARNFGIALATGEAIALLDADDLITPDRLRLQADVLQARPDWDGVFGQVRQFSDPPDLYPCDQNQQAAKLPGTLLVRRQVFATVGGFDPGYRAGEFIDWVLRAQEHGARFGDHPDLVLLRRLHATNSGRTQRDARQDYARVAMSALRRRRAANS